MNGVNYPHDREGASCRLLSVEDTNQTTLQSSSTRNEGSNSEEYLLAIPFYMIWYDYTLEEAMITSSQQYIPDIEGQHMNFVIQAYSVDVKTELVSLYPTLALACLRTTIEWRYRLGPEDVSRSR